MSMSFLNIQSDSLGMESLGLDVLLRLAASVNTAIHAQTSLWSSRDLDYASAMGLTYTPVIMEDIDKANMHLGHVPALIDAPIEQYPNLSVLSPDLSPVPTGGWDQGDDYALTFYVEIMVKDIVSQELVNRRAQRTMNAVHSVVMGDKTLGGKYSDLHVTAAGVSDVFIRREAKSRGPEWYWQGARLDYRVRVPVDF